MNDIVEAIVALFESDGGYNFSEEERAYAQGKWELLSDENKAFLAGLSSEGLTDICIGETRLDENDEAMWLINGDWGKLPPGVDAFLTDIWEFKS